MTEGEILLQAVRASPEDMTLRLVYSDWFEEQGDQARADYIRLQLPPDGVERGDELLYRHRMRWDGAVLRRLNAGPLRGQVHSRKGPVHRWEYRRGFIESITVQPAAFLAHGEELLQIGPIHEVHFIRGPVDWPELAQSGLLAGLRTIFVRRADYVRTRSSWGHPILYSASDIVQNIAQAIKRVEVITRWSYQDDHNGPSVLREQRHAGSPGQLRVIITG
jgi:uncharacterized protein (TIGR02996 family)